MKILIIGGGYLSTVLQNYFCEAGHAVEVLDYGSIDITKLASVTEVLRAHKPDFFINAAAFTDTNAAELLENQDKVYDINVHGPANLAYVARVLHIPWIHFSTAMMFDGAGPTGQGWSETNLPTPTNYYSQTKAWADAQLEPCAAQDSLYILRIHTPLAALSHARNFLNRLQKFDQAIDIPTSVTIVEDLAMVIEKLVTQKLPDGIYNVVNPGVISAFQIAQRMQSHGLIPAEKTLTPLNREQLDAMTHAKGGAHQTFPVLNTEKLAKIGIMLETAEMAVERTLENFHE